MGKVNHSYAVSFTPLRPWLILSSSGAIVCGNCVCMAGLGETCSYVGALLYWLEYTVCKREEISCTSGVNQWLEPRCTKKIPYLELVNIDAKQKHLGCKTVRGQSEATLQTGRHDQKV